MGRPLRASHGGPRASSPTQAPGLLCFSLWEKPLLPGSWLQLPGLFLVGWGLRGCAGPSPGLSEPTPARACHQAAPGGPTEPAWRRGAPRHTPSTAISAPGQAHRLAALSSGPAHCSPQAFPDSPALPPLDPLTSHVLACVLRGHEHPLHRGPGDTAPLTAEADTLALPSHLPSTRSWPWAATQAFEPGFAALRMASALKLPRGRSAERSLENTDVGALGQRAWCSHRSGRSSLLCPRAPGASTGLSFLYTSQQPRHLGARTGQDRQSVWQRSVSRLRQGGSECEQPGWPVLPLDSSRDPTLDVWSPLAKFSLPRHSRCSFHTSQSCHHGAEAPGDPAEKGEPGLGGRVALGDRDAGSI